METPFFTQEPNPLDKQVGGSHYKRWKIQPLEFVEANKLSWFGFVILKYLFRIESKTTSVEKQVEDLDKLIHYSRLKQLFLTQDIKEADATTDTDGQHDTTSQDSQTF
jgi:hypothetical protein